jgi:hypothetical protein
MASSNVSRAFVFQLVTSYSARKGANSSLIRLLIAGHELYTLLLHVRTLVLLTLTSALAVDSIPHKGQSLNSKPDHIAFPLFTTSLDLPCNRPLLTTHSQCNIPRGAIPRVATCRSRRPRLANSVCAAECFARILCKLGNDFGSGSLVVLGICVGPADEGFAAFERVKCQATAVESAGTGEREKGRGDEATGCLDQSAADL